MRMKNDIAINSGFESRFTQNYAAAIRMLRRIDGIVVNPSRYGDSAVIGLFTEDGECVRFCMTPDGNVSVGFVTKKGFAEPLAVALNVARTISVTGNVDIYLLGRSAK